MNNLNPNLADFVPTVLCLCRGDPQQIKELMEMALAAAAARLMDPPRQQSTKLLTTQEMAAALGTTPGNLRHHLGAIKSFLKDRGLRSHPNSPDRKLGEGRPGRHADGFTEKEIAAVVQRVQDLGSFTLAFPPSK